MKTAARAAVIGHGWGLHMHVPALREAGFNVEWLCGRDALRTKEAAEGANIPRSSIRPAEVLDSEVDLIAVAVPWAEHEPLAEILLNSACRSHLLLEHPAALKATTAHAMAERVSQSRMNVWVNLPTRFMPTALEIARLLKGGALGAVRRYVHSFAYPADEEADWLPLLSTHSLDFGRWLAGVQRVIEARLIEPKFSPVTDCPTWAWPLQSNQLPGGVAVTAEALEVVLEARGGVPYELRVGHWEGDAFLERFEALGEESSAGFSTRLLREDHTSPWATTSVWLGARPDEDVWHDVEDVWYTAHVTQARALRSIISGGSTAVLPATVHDAVAAHSLLEDGVAHALSS